ncbi:LPXTG cell wall anchor domain-containing protein [Plantactinospora sp. CA-294935]|uniref:LPXTG cell wall anchor domain-containing protein n=1 Tax=Plantactinospora sp. CA-294935 TaxID=3240012 RepID=UPI003D8F1084
MMSRAARVVPVLALAAALTMAPAAATAAQAKSPSLTVSPGALPADRVSTVTVTGKNYLVPPHAPGVDVFGGVYVFFGWVADAERFGPSIRNSRNNDGTVGVTYVYPGQAGDAGTRDDGSGAMRLVSFTAGGASGEATDVHMDGDGNWKTSLRIFGSTFTTTTPDGKNRSYDCRKVRCGVFTIGAHGVASATNEKFAPITFRAGGGAAPAAPPPTAGNGAAPSAGDASRPAAARSTGTPTGGPQAGPADSTDLVPGPDGNSDPGGVAVSTRSVRSTGGVSLPALVIAAGLVVALLAGGGLWQRRRRRSPGPTDSTPPVSPAQ